MNKSGYSTILCTSTRAYNSDSLLSTSCKQFKQTKKAWNWAKIKIRIKSTNKTLCSW